MEAIDAIDAIDFLEYGHKRLAEPGVWWGGKEEREGNRIDLPEGRCCIITALNEWRTPDIHGGPARTTADNTLRHFAGNTLLSQWNRAHELPDVLNLFDKAITHLKSRKATP